jgi:hypothetical protein
LTLSRRIRWSVSKSGWRKRRAFHLLSRFKLCAMLHLSSALQ